jgi:hypothetical protein
LKQEELIQVKVSNLLPFDDILKKYGMIEENKQVNINILFTNFLSQLKPEEEHGYLEIYEEIKAGLPDANKQTRLTKNCISILAQYLTEIMNKINKKLFNTILIFIKLYKDFMNLYGWDIIGKYKVVTAEERNTPFTAVRDAEHIPEGSNDFLRSFLPNQLPVFDKEIAIDLTFHLCQWLKHNNYTHTIIAPANQIT